MSVRERRSFIRGTVLFAIFMAFLLWLIFYNDYRLGNLGSFLPMSEQMKPLSINIILIPLAVSTIIFYVAVLVGIFRMQLAGQHVATEVVGERLPALAHRDQFLPALGDLFVLVLGRGFVWIGFVFV